MSSSRLLVATMCRGSTSNKLSRILKQGPGLRAVWGGPNSANSLRVSAHSVIARLFSSDKNTRTYIDDMHASALYQEAKALTSTKSAVEQENYEEIIEKLGRLSANSEVVKDIMKRLNEEYQQMQTMMFTMRSVQDVLQNLSFEDLTFLGIKFFTGSVSAPRNEQISQFLFDLAKDKTTSRSQELLLRFYQLYTLKLTAVQVGNKEKFEEVNGQILELTLPENRDDLPGVVFHTIGKELYKVGLNTLGSKNKKNRNTLMSQAEYFFRSAVEKNYVHSQYYLAEMYETGDTQGGTNLEQAVKLYQSAAAQDQPRALFKLCTFMKKGLILKHNPVLEYKYMKQAAELGLVEAMHNVGVMYLEGSVPYETDLSKDSKHRAQSNKEKSKDEVKALAWGFIESSVNACQILIRGTACGRVKPNKVAASMLIEKLRTSNSGINLDSLIARVRTMP